MIKTNSLPAPATLEDLAELDTGICGEPFQPFTVPVPLDRLLLSGLNVRQTERDADIASLAEDIFASGLKQNLVVIPAHFVSTGENRDHAGLFEVVAGGRRVQALQLLTADDRLPADHPVLCRIEPRETATESSLSENLHRVAMNPADEFVAFSKIVADMEKASQLPVEAVAACAKRFGVTMKHVEGRLRLAALAPEILEALRKGAITLDSAKAYAGSTDHKLQIKVFLDQCKPGAWRPHHPDQVRQELRGITLSLNDPQVKFIGLDAYRAAGGRTETEMFMGTDGEERLLDVKLVAQLAKAKAEPLVAPLAKVEGFKAGLLAPGITGYARMPKAPEGLEEHRSWSPTPGKATLKKSTAVYAIATDGTGIKRIGIFVPRFEKKPDPERPVYDWKVEQRKGQIFDRAAQAVARNELANMIAGAEWPDAVWPEPGANYIDAAEDDQDNEGQVLVVLQIRVPRAAIEARLPEAEIEHDAAEATCKESLGVAAGDTPESEGTKA